VNLAIADRDAYLDRKFNGKNINITKDPSHARWHTHQDALGIDVLMKVVTGVDMLEDVVWESKKQNRGIDDTIAFNPNCIGN